MNLFAVCMLVLAAFVFGTVYGDFTAKREESK